MTDPVDTDRLRELADDDEALGYPEAAAAERAAADELDRLRAELDAWEPAWRNMRDERDQARAANEDAEAARSAAASYGDRLRTVIDNAPHDDECHVDPNDIDPCTCWKADALG